MLRTNCLVFAFRQFRRHGGYLLIRRSKHLPVPHVLWAPDGSLDTAPVVHFVPDHPVRERWKIWACLRFAGHIKLGDSSGAQGDLPRDPAQLVLF